MVRRDFIKKTGILAGGMMLHQQMLQAFSLQDKSEKIKIGIIGCGDRGKGLLHVLKQLPENFEITAICDVLNFRLDETRKLDTAGRWKVYKDYRRMLDDRSIQAVCISTPLNMHYPIAAAALQAGKHIYLEKTMTYNNQEALNLVKAAADHPKQIVQVGHQYRYTPLYYQVKEMIEKGYLGKVMQIDCRWDRNWNWKRPVPDPSLERQINWRMYKEYSGGLAAELLSHQIDFINWAFDTHPDEIFAMGGIDYYKDGREVHDNMQAVLRYEKAGMIGNFGATCANAHDGYLFRLKGKKGTVALLMHEGIFYPEKETRKELEVVDGVSGATKITWNEDGGIPILKERTKDGTWYALKDFHKAIMLQKQPDSNVVTGATTSFCVHLINQSLFQQGVEKWKPEFNL